MNEEGACSLGMRTMEKVLREERSQRVNISLLEEDTCLPSTLMTEENAAIWWWDTIRRISTLIPEHRPWLLPLSPPLFEHPERLSSPPWQDDMLLAVAHKPHITRRCRKANMQSANLSRSSSPASRSASRVCDSRRRRCRMLGLVTLQEEMQLRMLRERRRHRCIIIFINTLRRIIFCSLGGDRYLRHLADRERDID